MPVPAPEEGNRKLTAQEFIDLIFTAAVRIKDNALSDQLLQDREAVAYGGAVHFIGTAGITDQGSV